MKTNLNENYPVFVALIINVLQSLQHFCRVDITLLNCKRWKCQDIGAWWYQCKYKYVKFTSDQLLRDSFLHPPKYGTLPAEKTNKLTSLQKKLFQLLKHQQPRSFPPARRRTRSTVWGGCSVAWPSNIYIQDSYLYIYIWLIFEAPLTIKYCSQCLSKVISNVTFTEVLLNVTSTVISIYHVKNINCQIECHVKCFLQRSYKCTS